MNVTIEISKEFEGLWCGVYMMGFSNGFYYIGASKQLQVRLKTHIGIIKSDFKSSSTPKSLRKMSGFEGIVTFSLLEKVDIKWRKWGLGADIIAIERSYKQKYHSDEYLLNLTPVLV